MLLNVTQLSEMGRGLMICQLEFCETNNKNQVSEIGISTENSVRGLTVVTANLNFV